MHYNPHNLKCGLKDAHFSYYYTHRLSAKSRRHARSGAWNHKKYVFRLGGKNSTCLHWLHDLCFSAICVQIVALGWCFGDKAYLRSSWNILDGMLVLISVIDILVSLISNSGTKILGMLRVLRLLRTLRPLRWVSFLGTSKFREWRTFGFIHDVQY